MLEQVRKRVVQGAALLAGAGALTGVGSLSAQIGPDATDRGFPDPPPVDLSNYRQGSDGDSYLDYMNVYVEVDGTLIGAGSMRQYRVYNPTNGQLLGRVLDIAVDQQSGEARHLLLQPDGYLLGELVAIPVASVSLEKPSGFGESEQDTLLVHRILYLEAPKEQLNALATYGLTEDFAGYLSENADRIAETFGATSASGAQQTAPAQHVLVFRDGAGSIAEADDEEPTDVEGGAADAASEGEGESEGRRRSRG